MNKEASMYRELSLYLRLRTHCTRGEVEQRSSCCSLHVEPVRLPPAPNSPAPQNPGLLGAPLNGEGVRGTGQTTPEPLMAGGGEDPGVLCKNRPRPQSGLGCLSLS